MSESCRDHIKELVRHMSGFFHFQKNLLMSHQGLSFRLNI